MNHKKLARTLSFLRPNAAFVIFDDMVQWLDDRPEPTQAEIDAAWPEAERAEKAKEVRRERDRFLTASDWTQVADSSVDSLEWQPYRQALRDVPQQAGFPDSVDWPVPPDA